MIKAIKEWAEHLGRMPGRWIRTTIFQYKSKCGTLQGRPTERWNEDF